MTLTNTDAIWGSIPALATAFTESGEVDFDAFSEHVDWVIREGSHGVVPTGTTGESPTLDHSEHKALVSKAVEVVANRVPVIAGTGSNNTKEAVELSAFAEKTGADALLVVTPYYNRPSPEGLFQHFKAIHEATRLPIIVYNVPSRTALDILPETMKRLASLERVVGSKDATGDLLRPWAEEESCGADFIRLSGNDASILPFMSWGCRGCISVTANVAPAPCASLHEALKAGNWNAARKINAALMPLHEALFADSSPAPTKYALSEVRSFPPHVRLPLVPASTLARKAVDEALRHAGLL